MELMDALGPWWVYAVAAFAGFVSFRDVFSWDDTWKRTALKLLMHQLTSAFAGFLAFHFSTIAMGSIQMEKAARASLMVISVGILSWRGAKGLTWIAEWWERRNGGAGGAK